MLKGLKPDKIPDPSGSGKKIVDFWGPSKKMLNDLKFLESLKTYDKDNVPQSVMKEIRAKYIVNPEFVPEKIKNASTACEGICKWVLAIEKYDRVAKIIAPKREALKKAETEFNLAMSDLKLKQENLREIQNKLQKLVDELEANKARKMDLEQQAELCKTKLMRAEQLLGGLGGEKKRWIEEANRLAELGKCVTGDILLSSAVVAYLGNFTPDFRAEQIMSWLESIRSSSLLCSEGFSLQSTIGQAVEIRDWLIQKLPNDSFSIENALIKK